MASWFRACAGSSITAWAPAELTFNRAASTGTRGSSVRGVADVGLPGQELSSCNCPTWKHFSASSGPAPA
jgi:hypothetical protein